MNTPQVDWSKLDAALQEIKQTDPRPGPEWFTVAEYMRQPGVNVRYNQAARRLRELHASGGVERQIVSGTVYYRLID